MYLLLVVTTVARATNVLGYKLVDPWLLANSVYLRWLITYHLERAVPLEAVCAAALEVVWSASLG